MRSFVDADFEPQAVSLFGKRGGGKLLGRAEASIPWVELLLARPKPIDHCLLDDLRWPSSI